MTFSIVAHWKGVTQATRSVLVPDECTAVIPVQTWCGESVACVRQPVPSFQRL